MRRNVFSRFRSYLLEDGRGSGGGLSCLPAFAVRLKSFLGVASLIALGPEMSSIIRFASGFRLGLYCGRCVCLEVERLVSVLPSVWLV